MVVPPSLLYAMKEFLPLSLSFSLRISLRMSLRNLSKNAETSTTVILLYEVAVLKNLTHLVLFL